jgi:Repeat of Unknown Function (DUF347)
MAAMSGAWFRRKVRHAWLGGPRRLTMYVATVDCATLNPSLRSSPWKRGAPQSKFSILIWRLSKITSGLGAIDRFLIRAAGTAVGDFISGRNMLGLPVSTAVTGALFIALLVIWREQSRS